MHAIARSRGVDAESIDLFALTGTLTGSSDIPRELLKAVERARGCHVGEDIGYDG